MKNKEELYALKKEVETLNKKLAELTEEELAQVTGGFDTSFVYTDPETGLPITGWRNDLPGWEGKWFYFSNGEPPALP